MKGKEQEQEPSRVEKAMQAFDDEWDREMRKMRDRIAGGTFFSPIQSIRDCKFV